METSYETIRTELEGRVLTVAVNRPDSRNAVNVTLLDELADVMARAEEHENIRVVVLRGDGDGIFIAGGDIATFSDTDGDWFLNVFNPAAERMEEAMEGNALPIIAAVDGLALGGGTEIAMMCDMIVASEDAAFGTPEIRLGLIPGVGGTQRLTRLVGYLKAKEIIMTGRQVPAQEAAEIGLANRAVPASEFEEEVYDLAADLAQGAPLAQQYAKLAVNHARPALDDGRALESVLTRTLFDSDESDEGVAAFLANRPPEFGH
jgi:enoyl-CoA hydratase/carnithine racemase